MQTREKENIPISPYISPYMSLYLPGTDRACEDHELAFIFLHNNRLVGMAFIT